MTTKKWEEALSRLEEKYRILESISNRLNAYNQDLLLHEEKTHKIRIEIFKMQKDIYHSVSEMKQAIKWLRR